ncbi:MAG TPA: ankyrin repeat domain-containing protein [Candidatus Babeliales bacterium]|nr:ankyrin repeat domain-containing protein [Candidatus Babeliales bacterium]
MKNIHVLLCLVLLNSVCPMQANWKHVLALRAEGAKKNAPKFLASALATAVSIKLMRMPDKPLLNTGGILGIGVSSLSVIDALVQIWNYPADKASQQLLKAIKMGDAVAVEKYIQRGFDINRTGRPLSSEVSVDDHFTPMQAAAYYGNADILRLLIKHKAKIDAHSLPFAAQQGHAEAVKVLVEDGKANIYTGMSYATGQAREYLGQRYLAMDKQKPAQQ